MIERDNIAADLRASCQWIERLKLRLTDEANREAAADAKGWIALAIEALDAIDPADEKGPIIV